MRKLLLLILITCYSCNNDDDNNSNIVNKWQLMEVLYDPGDGSGTFQPVTSSKTIEFYDDGTFHSKGSICNVSTESDSNYYGTYSNQNSTLTSIQCQQQTSSTIYEINANTLIIYYPCIEACAEKYTKIE